MGDGAGWDRFEVDFVDTGALGIVNFVGTGALGIYDFVGTGALRMPSLG